VGRAAIPGRALRTAPQIQIRRRPPAAGRPGPEDDAPALRKLPWE